MWSVSPVHAGPPHDDVDLLGGAETLVPAEMNAGFVDVFGVPVGDIRTRVTGVQFFVGDTPSNVPGGLSAVPVPTLRDSGGVLYWEVAGILSGIGFGSCYHNYVYGPVDGNGVDTSLDPDYDGPRKNLAGVPFRIAFPAERSWNGKIVQNRHGGAWTTPVLLFFENYDPYMVVADGGAYVAIGGGGFSADEDQNFHSDTTDFFEMKIAENFLGEVGPLVFGPPTQHRPTVRFARVGDDGTETNCPECCFGATFGSDLNTFDTLSLNADASLARDGSIAMENVLHAVTGRRTKNHILTIHSFSGFPARTVNHGRFEFRDGFLGGLCLDPVVCGPAFLNSARLGNNHRIAYDPSSGVIFDAIVELFSGINTENFAPDHEYPISARTIWVNGSADGAGSTSSFVAAQRINEALPTSATPELTLEDTFRVYFLEGMPHEAKQMWADRLYDHSGVFWDESAPEGDQFNTEGRGESLQFLAAKFEQFYPGYFETAHGHYDSVPGYATKPDFNPFIAQTFENAFKWAKGHAPPVSYLDKRLIDLALAGDLDETIVFPGYPIVDCGDPLGAACLDGLDQDSVTTFFTDAVGNTGYVSTLTPEVVESVYALVDGTVPLDYEVGLALPEYSVRTRFYLFDFFNQWSRVLTPDELAAEGLNDIHAYKRQLKKASSSLVQKGLLDASIAADSVKKAVARAATLFD